MIIKRPIIGILQTALLSSDLSLNFPQYFEVFSDFLGHENFDFAQFRVCENEFPSDYQTCDGWLITGSHHGVYENHDWIPVLEDLIREIHANNIPLVGICFGHQIMAQALGGKVEKFIGGWGVSTHNYHDLQTGKTIALLCSHQDQIIEKPSNSKVIMTSTFCKYAGLQYTPNCVSFQPHPEFKPEFMEAVLHLRRGTRIPEDVADEGLRRLHHPNDADTYATYIRNIFFAS
jgi:GMP synthase (glutamine-hydrolysing)